jgi:hypothetical protein
MGYTKEIEDLKRITKETEQIRIIKILISEVSKDLSLSLEEMQLINRLIGKIEDS